MTDPLRKMVEEAYQANVREIVEKGFVEEVGAEGWTREALFGLQYSSLLELQGIHAAMYYQKRGPTEDEALSLASLSAIMIIINGLLFSGEELKFGSPDLGRQLMGAFDHIGFKDAINEVAVMTPGGTA